MKWLQVMWRIQQDQRYRSFILIKLIAVLPMRAVFLQPFLSLLRMRAKSIFQTTLTVLFRTPGVMVIEAHCRITIGRTILWSAPSGPSDLAAFPESAPSLDLRLMMLK